MPRRIYDQAFRDGAVRLIEETRRPVAQVARELDVQESTLRNWLSRYGGRSNGAGTDLAAENARLRRELAEVRQERDVLKRSVVLWVKEATTR